GTCRARVVPPDAAPVVVGADGGATVSPYATLLRSARGRAVGSGAAHALPRLCRALIGTSALGGAGARPPRIDAGLEPSPGLSGGRGLSGIPQAPLARRTPALAGERTGHRSRRQGTLRSGCGACAGHRSRRPLCRTSGPHSRGAGPEARDGGGGSVRHRALRALVVRGAGLPGGGVPRFADG